MGKVRSLFIDRTFIITNDQITRYKSEDNTQASNYKGNIFKTMKKQIKDGI
jgi:hypothetical protein